MRIIIILHYKTKIPNNAKHQQKQTALHFSSHKTHFLIVLGGITKNVYCGIFQKTVSWYMIVFSFSCIIRCSQHFLLVERGITSPF